MSHSLAFRPPSLEENKECVREVVVASDIKLERGSELRSQCDGDCLDSGQDSIHLAA